MEPVDQAQLNAILEEFRAHREEIRREFEASNRKWEAGFAATREEQRRHFAAIEARMANDRELTRQMLIELREGREVWADIRHGIQTSIEGLMDILAELRRGDGPSPASA
jgi:hypothetical protein